MPVSEWSGSKEVTAEIDGALRRRLGEERHQWWFSQGLQLVAEPDHVRCLAPTPFVVERIRKRLIAHLKEAAQEVYGCATTVRLEIAEVAVQTTITHQEQSIASVLRLSDTQEPERPSRQRTNRGRVAGDRPRVQPVNHADQGGVGGGNSSAAGETSGAGTPNVRRRLTAPQPTVPHPTAAVRRVDDDNATSADAGPAASQLTRASLANFQVGPCNQLAHVAAKMVIEQPGSPSPLFFWGPAGVGKTHLLAAIRNELRTRHKLRRVVMLSAEQFTNDFTSAVRGSGLPGFRRRYRDVEALLIDDVQFVGGKRATLRELLYTVDTLLRGRCQMAFTADRPPMELEGLNEELAGRMAGGMVCPLRPLDRDTRRDVLRAMAEFHGATVSGEVIEKLADELSGDGRILSGAINHLRALGQMQGRPATWDELLASAPELINAGRPAVNLGDIQKAVCDMFGLPTGSLRSRGQQRSVSQPRMLAMYLARQYTRAAFSEIGEYFGNRSHSTVIAATKRVEDWISDGKPLRRGAQTLPPRQLIEAIENLLRTG